MTALDILREGRPSSEFTVGKGYRFANHLPLVICKDGFTLSVQASSLHYSTPHNDRGPWSHVEVGFPSAVPEPWQDWERYCETPTHPTDTVYAQVPLSLVLALIDSHGGPA